MMKREMKRRVRGVSWLGVGALGAGLWACPAGDVGVAPSAAAGAAPVARVAPGAATAESLAARQREAPQAPAPWRIPVGPTLLIMPGKGVGPIRFGARQDTIERLIGEPCEERRVEPSGVVVCRYSAQAIEFFLVNGVVKEIRAHRLGRPFKPEPKLDFGIFNGRLEAGAGFGMLQAGVEEFLGKPKSVRKVEKVEKPDAENPNLTVEVHEYDGVTLEYDRLGPERVVLGGVIIKASK